MSFDVLAPHYRWMEWVLAGGKLQRCRTTFLGDVQRARHVVMLGEGNGRFLRAFTAMNTSAEILVVDASAAMLARAERGAWPAANRHRIAFLRHDVLTWAPPPNEFDLIVTNFFLDCFAADQLQTLLPRLASCAQKEAQWLISDFRVPAGGLARWRARWIIAVMYCFFRRVTRVGARTLTPIDALLEQEGFVLRRRQLSDWGLLHADLWQRGAQRRDSSEAETRGAATGQDSALEHGLATRHVTQ